MKYILFLIEITTNGVDISNHGSFDEINLCFDKRELLVEEKGRPIVNYQALCILNDTTLSHLKYNNIRGSTI